MSAYPEHAKIDEAVAEAIVSFVNWLTDNGFVIVAKNLAFPVTPVTQHPLAINGETWALLYHGVDLVAYDREVATLTAEQQARIAAVQGEEQP